MTDNSKAKIQYTHREDLDVLEERLGYSFTNKELLIRALTHRSYANEQDDVDSDNQRLEFLGDAVLGLVTAQKLYERDRDAQEGILSSRQSQMVCEAALANIARDVELGTFVHLGRGETLTGGRDKSGLLSDAYEAILAAIYLDGGLQAAIDVVEKLHANDFAEVTDQVASGAAASDYKSIFQKLVQAHRSHRPEYEIINQFGPAHDRTFVAQVCVENKVYGTGEGSSKKQAEQVAAKEALQYWVQQFNFNFDIEEQQ